VDVVGTLQPPDTAKLRDFLWLGVDPNAGGGTLLESAATWGNVEHLDILLKAGARIDATNADGWTPLMVAAARTPFLQPPPPDDNVAAVRFLLDSGAEVNRRSRRGWTALMLAVGRGSSANAELLISAGADRRGVEQARFVNAALAGEADVMRQALAEGAEADAFTEPVGWTALGWASRQGSVEAVDVLLRAGADANRPDERGMTPLLHAAGAEEWNYFEGHLAVVKRLLAAGADVRARAPGPNRWTALTMAMHEDVDAELEQVLIGAGADADESRAQIEAYQEECRRRQQELPPVSTVFSIIQSGRNDLLRSYVARGFNVNDEGYNGVTPLMYAARCDNAEAVRLLLDAGAKADAMTIYGQTALKNAALRGATAVVRFLFAAGVDAGSKDAELALRWADAAGHDEVAGVLRPGTTSNRR
jgi:ankyrin repeat protein